VTEHSSGCPRAAAIGAARSRATQQRHRPAWTSVRTHRCKERTARGILHRCVQVDHLHAHLRPESLRGNLAATHHNARAPACMCRYPSHHTHIGCAADAQRMRSGCASARNRARPSRREPPSTVSRRERVAAGMDERSKRRHAFPFQERKIWLRPRPTCRLTRAVRGPPIRTSRRVRQ